MPLANKGKGKGRDGRRSRSRNTTPSSVISAGTGPVIPSATPYLEVDTSKLHVPSHPQYGDILDRLDTKSGVPEPKHLETLVEQLRQLSEAAEARAQVCDAAMRELADKRKAIADEERERERLDHELELRKAKAKRDTEERSDGAGGKRAPKPKKRKERSEALEEKLAHISDGVEVKVEGKTPDYAIATAFQAGPRTAFSASAYFSITDEPEKPRVVRAAKTPGPVDSPSPSKKAKLSPGTSSLSDIAQSPDAAPDMENQNTPAKADVEMDSSDDDRIIPPPPPVAQHTFFPDPLAPDPIIYHIREVTPGMIDEEKKEIYSVRGFPTKDLSDQIAGTPPDKDFSNAKPTNQVAANTFLAYVEPYVRQLTEEDMAFLRERGDRTTPFLSVPRGKRHYTEIWAEEDGTISLDSGNDKLSANQARGNIEQISDETVSTDQVSQGPLASRLLSLLRFEHRPPPSETANGTSGDLTNAFTNGDGMDLDGLPNGHIDISGEDKPLPIAASVADLVGSKSSSSLGSKLEYAQADERIKMELRHLGFLGQDEAPDFDGHHDDDISERLRLLQAELRKVMITNGARKSRLLEIAKERLAYQEYNTIHEDLDSQVQQAYLKRTRTLGKTKKGGPGAGKPRPGGHVVSAGGTAGAVTGMSRARDIGDNARMLMDRRKRWEDCIGGVFEGMKHGVPGKETSLWDPRVMAAYEKAEMEGWEEEGE